MTHVQQACTCGCNNQPQAFISVRKNRVKAKNGSVYLNNGTEFEIEFFNYSSDIQKAVITINGKVQRDALVLKPGEHFYLERFMDTNHRLKFDTYEVDDVAETQKAIENNGEVKVEFFREYKPQYYWTMSSAGTGNWQQPYIQSYTANTRTINTSYTNNASATLGVNSMNITCDTSNMKSMKKTRSAAPQAQAFYAAAAMPEPAKIETGRVEQGAQSGQKFKEVYYTFEFFANKVVTFKLLPVSRRDENVVPTSQIRTYCPQCARRVKKGHRFCAGCGQDLRNI